MTKPALTLRPRYARPVLEFDERRARYAFLTPLVEAALAVELIDPKKAQVPGNAFLESIGASTSFSICCTPEEPLTPEALDTIEAKSIGEPPLFLIDDGSAWLAHSNTLDQLIEDIDRRLPRAKFAFTFRNPRGVSLSSFGDVLSLGDILPFDFAACEQALQKRFAIVKLATQSALWGSQIAPLAGENLVSAIDGSLGDQPRAAFFIALCSQKPFNLPEEITLLPLPLAPLSAAAERFDKMSDNLRKSESDRLRLEELLRQKNATAHDVEETKSKVLAAEAERDAAKASAQEATNKLRQAESLLDEVAQERSQLVAKLAQAEKDLEEALRALEEKTRQFEEAASQRDQTRRNKDHLALTPETLQELEEKLGSVAMSSPPTLSKSRLAQAFQRANSSLPVDGWRKMSPVSHALASQLSDKTDRTPDQPSTQATSETASASEPSNPPTASSMDSNSGEESNS